MRNLLGLSPMQNVKCWAGRRGGATSVSMTQQKIVPLKCMGFFEEENRRELAWTEDGLYVVILALG